MKFLSFEYDGERRNVVVLEETMTTYKGWDLDKEDWRNFTTSKCRHVKSLKYYNAVPIDYVANISPSDNSYLYKDTKSKLFYLIEKPNQKVTAVFTGDAVELQFEGRKMSFSIVAGQLRLGYNGRTYTAPTIDNFIDAFDNLKGYR